MKHLKPGLIALLFAIILSCTTVEPELKIIHQVTGPIETNCYLIYDNQTMEAALVDVGDAIDTLLQYIEEKTWILNTSYAHMVTMIMLLVYLISLTGSLRQKRLSISWIMTICWSRVNGSLKIWILNSLSG